MRLQIHAIHPALQPFVKLICSMECDEESDTQPIRVLPDTCVELFFNYTPSPLAIIDQKLHRRSIANFRMNQPMEVQMRKGTGSMAVCFYPGKAYPFFTEDMNIFSNTTIALSDIWRQLSEEIEDRLSKQLTNNCRAEVVQGCLLRKIRREPHDTQLEYCLHRINHSHGSVSIARLSEKVGLSQRHLSRIFQKRLGLSPKEYIRMTRFLRSLSYLKDYPARSLTEIAYRSGYYDQAHFNRDFKTYAGYTPGEVAVAGDILY